MVHKKFITKNGKVHGPYYYESYRDGGQIKKRYLGSKVPSSSGTLWILFFSILLIGGLFFIGYISITGKSIDGGEDSGSSDSSSSDSGNGGSDSSSSSDGTSDTSSESSSGSSNDGSGSGNSEGNSGNSESSSGSESDVPSDSSESNAENAPSGVPDSSSGSGSESQPDSEDPSLPEESEPVNPDPTDTNEPSEPSEDVPSSDVPESEDPAPDAGGGSGSSDELPIVDDVPSNDSEEVPSNESLPIYEPQEPEQNETEQNDTEQNQTEQNETQAIPTIPEIPFNETINETIINNTIPEIPFNETINVTIDNETVINTTVENVSSELFLLNSLPVVRIPFGGEARLDLENYISGANGYNVSAENISVSFVGSLMILRAENNFTGVRYAKLTAYNSTDSLSDIPFTIFVSSGAITIVTSREMVRVGESVKWTKNISLGDMADFTPNFTIELPAEAVNISLQRLDDPVAFSSLLTGNVIGTNSENSFFAWLKNFIFRIFSSFTGRAIAIDEAVYLENVSTISEGVNESKIHVFVNVSAPSYILEYYTPGPKRYDESFVGGQRIIISAPDELNYTDVIASLNLTEEFSVTDPSVLRLYWHNFDFNLSETSFKRVDEVVPLNVVEFIENGSSSQESAAESSFNITNNTITEENNVSLNDSLPDLSINSTESNASFSLITGNVVEETSEILNETFSISNNDSEFIENISAYVPVEGVDYIKQEVLFDSYDLDGDGKLDYIEWVVPHLSNQTFTLVLVNGTFASQNITITSNYSRISFANNTIYNSLVDYLNFDIDKYNGTAYGMRGVLNGTYVNGAYSNTTSCIFDDCLHLNGGVGGVHSGVQVTNTAALNTSNFTFSVWVRSANSSQNGGVIEKTVGGVANTQYLLYAGTSSYVFRINLSNGTLLDISSSGLAEDVWTHFAGTFNGSQMILYRNGAIVTSRNGSAMSMGAGDLLVGRLGSTAYPFNGTIDELMFFNSTLNSTHILQIFNNQSSRFMSQGTIEVPQYNISSGKTYVDMNLEGYERKFGSNISLRVGSWYKDLGYNDSDITLKGSYHFDTSFNDSNGRSNGTSYGVVLNTSAGIYGGSIRFNGTKDSVNISHDQGINFNITEPFTISFWLYAVPSSSTTTSYLIVKGDSSSANPYVITYTRTNGRISCAIQEDVDQGGTTTTITGTSNVTGRWTHVTCSSDASTLRLYINGTQEQTGSFNVASFDDTRTSLPLFIGSYSNQSATFLNGSIDEVYIFNRTLPATEITKYYIQGRANWTFSTYQNITSINSLDNKSSTRFSITPSTTNIFPNFMLSSGPNVSTPFYTPFLRADGLQPALFIVNTYTVCNATYGCFFVKNASGANRTIFDQFGTIDLSGSLIPSSVGTPGTQASFILKNSTSGSVVAWINSTSGTLRLAGTMSSNTGTSCTPPARSFVIRNTSGSCVSYIDSNGNLWLRGELNQNVSL